MASTRRATRTTAAQGSALRRYRRAAVLWSGRLRRGGTVDDCVVLNVSANGARLRTTEPLPRQARVVLDGEHFGGLAGRVVWARDAVAGIQFQHPPAEVVAALARSAAPGTSPRP